MPGAYIKENDLPQLVEDEAVKETMGYEDGSYCCRTCANFRTSDHLSDTRTALPERCVASGMYWMRVAPEGHCRFHEVEPEKDL